MVPVVRACPLVAPENRMVELVFSLVVAVRVFTPISSITASLAAPPLSRLFAVILPDAVLVPDPVRLRFW